MRYLALVVVACCSLSTAFAQVAEEDITRKQLDLGIFALKEGIKGGPNVTLSPYSIHSALILLRLGSRGAVASEIDTKLLPGSFSPTVQQAYAGLETQVSLSTESVTSHVANSLWLQEGFRFQEEYLKDSKRIFGAEPHHVDFTDLEKARGGINRWVSSKTNDLIRDLLTPGALDAATRCVLVNALYFKSPWISPFHKRITREGDFWVNSSATVKVPMMSTVDRMEYFEDSSWQGVQLRYQGLDFGFVLLLPKKRLAPGELIGALSSDLVDRSLRDAAFAKVELSLPRFKTRSSMDLLDTLTAYGLGHLRDGDYSGVSTADVVRLGGVIHEAVVSVDEEGTEAAAATAIAMVGSGAPLREDKPKKVRADHPFAFAIVHRSSGAPLFVGVVGDPR